MDEERIAKEKKRIDRLEYWELAYLWRFCGDKHPYFNGKLPLYKHLETRFLEFGGMTKDMSRNIPWEREPQLDIDGLVKWGNETGSANGH